MIHNLYDEIVKSHPLDLNVNEYYSIPLKYANVELILKLLCQNKSYETYDEICSFLNEEYDLKFNFDLQSLF